MIPWSDRLYEEIIRALASGLSSLQATNPGITFIPPFISVDLVQ